MFQLSLFKQLHTDGLIDEQQLNEVRLHNDTAPVSLHWDLLTLLYLGIFCFVTALGIIIYLNIDSIGHIAITAFIAVACISCFSWCIKKALPFSPQKVQSPNVYFDYVLLLGCLLMLTLVGYLQFQFGVFGNRWGLATFVPMLVLFAAAYYFDHLGVLSLGITNLAAWAGIVITPSQLLRSNDFNSDRIIYTGVALGVLLLLLAFVSVQKNYKGHFSFTYKNFGAHLLFISLLGGMFTFAGWYLLWLLVLAGFAYYLFTQALQTASFYFLLIGTLYFYVGVSYVVSKVLFSNASGGVLSVYLMLLYVILSAIALVFFLIRYNAIIKKHDSLS